MSAPTLRTENLLIRAFKSEDLKAFAQYRSQPEVSKYQSWEDYTCHDAWALFESMDYTTFGEIGQWYQLAISNCETDELLGDLAVHFIDEKQIELGFTVNPQCQRQNIATKATTLFLGYAFGHLKKHRVIATTDTKNVAAYRLLEKLGFRREAHFKQNIYFKRAWGDEYQYALLHSEQKFT
jgi:RimJ/RimL family protein N-acetyltransferase